MSQEQDDEFSNTVEAYLAGGDRDKRVAAIADHFEMLKSTAERWAKGTGRPHPRLQKQVLKWIKEQQ